MKGIDSKGSHSIRWEAEVSMHTSWFRVKQVLPLVPHRLLPAPADLCHGNFRQVTTTFVPAHSTLAGRS